MPSPLGFVFRVEAEVNQGIVALARLHDDIAATSAVSAGRAAAGHKLFPPEGNTPIAAVPRLDPNSVPHR